MSLEWTATQISKRVAPNGGLGLATARYNPRPAGVILAGSASDTVLAVLRARPGLWLTHAQILGLTSRSTKSVCWALMFLQAQQLVESTPDDSRNSRYRRYRAAKGEARP